MEDIKKLEVGEKAEYVVVSGDTLSAIAEKYGVSVSEISGYKSNDPDLIYPEEVLTIEKK